MRLTVALALSLGLAAQPASVTAQQPGVPDSATMAQMFNQMGPMYQGMAQQMMEGTLKALERPETVDRLARIARRYYDALLKQGFTKEEALQIVAHAGIAGTRSAQ